MKNICHMMLNKISIYELQEVRKFIKIPTKPMKLEEVVTSKINYI